MKPLNDAEILIKLQESEAQASESEVRLSHEEVMANVRESLVN